VVAIWFYPITGKDVERIGSELAEQKT